MNSRAGTMLAALRTAKRQAPPAGRRVLTRVGSVWASGWRVWLGSLPVWLWLATGWLRLDAAPVVAGFNPVMGPPGTAVELVGSGFVNVTEVRFNQASALFTVVSSTRIQTTVPVDATTGPIAVLSASGVGTSAAWFQLPPTVLSFTPVSGLPGTEVTIRGRNLEGASAVTFAGKPAAFTVVAPTQINAAVPANAVSGLIVVTSAAGSGVSAEAFAVGNLPGISSVLPGHGLPGEVVVIRGVNFTGVTNVAFNGTNAVFQIVAATQINATVPSGATTGPISVRSAAGAGVTSQAFVVDDGRPVLVGFTPASGAIGDRVLIQGERLDAVTGVWFHLQSAAFSINAATQIEAVVPTGATTGSIVVSNRFGSVTSALPFQVAGPIPSISSFSPLVGRVGDEVIIRGANFDGTRAVTFGGSNATFSVVASSQINAQVPVDARTGPIVVTNVYGAATSVIPFTVLGPAPVVAAFTPQTGPVGTRVRIEGANFETVTAVRFQGVLAAFSVNAPTQIEAMVPVGATTGPITVEALAGTNTTTALFYLPPAIDSLVPAAGIAGDVIAIRGQNLVGTTEVRFNQAVATVLAVTTNEVRAVVPLLATTGTLSVQTPAGIVATPTNFVVRPWVSGFTPAAGGPGTGVKVSGAGFAGVLAVRFGGVAAEFHVTNSTTIGAVVPPAPLTGPIEVETVDGIGRSAQPFYVATSSDLAVLQAGPGAAVEPGSEWVQTLVITNAGPSVAVDVVLTNATPAGARLTGWSASQGTVTQLLGVVTARLGTITNTMQATVQLRMVADQSRVVTNRVGAASIVPDPRQTNNGSEDRIRVLTEAERTLHIQQESAQVLLLSWPVSEVPSVLETSPAVGAPWLPFGGPVTQVGTNRVATNTVTGVQLWFRLQFP